MPSVSGREQQPQRRTKTSARRVPTGDFTPQSPFDRWLAAGQSQLPPEIEQDNIEYKWRLTDMDDNRRVHLVTQMRWRVGELGHCWYVLGVRDNGALDGIEAAVLNDTLEVLEDLATRAELHIATVETAVLSAPTATARFICQVRIEAERVSLSLAAPEAKVAFLGDTNAGKTTLISVLSEGGGVLDDGRGKMRTRLLHHRHELLSGTTSSVTIQPVAFSVSTGQLLVPDDAIGLGLGLAMRRELLQHAKIVHLIDSAGKLRFDHTLLSILTATHQPSLVCVVLEAPPSTAGNGALSSHSAEILRLALALELPLAIIVSKIDQSSTEAIAGLLEQTARVLEGRRQLSLYDPAAAAPPAHTCPVVLCSAVSGECLDTLTAFLFRVVSPVAGPSGAALVVEQHAAVDGLGPVVLGHVASGTIAQGDAMLLGPLAAARNGTTHGAMVSVRVASIQRLRFPVRAVHAGQCVAIALELPADIRINRGMALVRPHDGRDDSVSSDSVSSDSASHDSVPSPSRAIPTLRPIRRIIAQIVRINTTPVKHPHTHRHPNNEHSLATDNNECFVGVLFVAGQRFPAVLNAEPRALHRRFTRMSEGSRAVCLVTLREARPATVLLQPDMAMIFVEGCTGRRSKFVGRIMDYFA